MITDADPLVYLALRQSGDLEWVDVFGQTYWAVDERMGIRGLSLPRVPDRSFSAFVSAQ